MSIQYERELFSAPEAVTIYGYARFLGHDHKQAVLTADTHVGSQDVSSTAIQALLGIHTWRGSPHLDCSNFDSWKICEKEFRLLREKCERARAHSTPFGQACFELGVAILDNLNLLYRLPADLER